jgi:hypothetical protein
MKTSQTNQEADRDAQQHQHGDPNVAQYPLAMLHNNPPNRPPMKTILTPSSMKRQYVPCFRTIVHVPPFVTVFKQGSLVPASSPLRITIGEKSRLQSLTEASCSQHGNGPERGYKKFGLHAFND